MPPSSLPPKPCRVLAQTALHPPFFLTEIEAPELAARVTAGQFVMLRAPGVGDPLLGRPFSVYGLGREAGGAPRSVKLLYNIVGRGTALFAAATPGDTLLVMGPLGQGFRLEPPPARALLVAGGIGIAAFLLLAEELAKLRIPTRLLYGARTAADLIETERFAELGVAIDAATDDGSRGHQGFVTQLLEEHLRQGEPPGLAVYACGPTPMLRRVREITLARGVPAQLALEARMACGFGVCLGCAVPSASDPGTYHLVCKDGPCLPASEVLL